MEPYWYVTKDGDVSCLALYERHYSCRRYTDGRKRVQFVGPGEHLVLRTAFADAMFVWRKFIDDTIPKQDGVNCAVFRNEGPIRASDLSDRLTPSLITAGLVRGITPTSSRRQFGARSLDIASAELAGAAQASRAAACSSSSVARDTDHKNAAAGESS